MSTTGERAAPAFAPLWNSPLLLLGMTSLIWAGHAIVGRLAAGQIGPMTLTSARWTLALAPILVAAAGDLKADAPKLLARWPYVAAMGALGYTAFNALYYVAAHSTSAINLSILQGVIPALTLLGARAWLKTPVSARQAIGVIATMVGVVLVATQGEPARLLTFAFNRGDVLTLIAVVIYALYTLGLAKKPNVKPLSLLAGFAVAAMLSSLPLTAYEIASGGFIWPTAIGYGALVYAAIGPAFLSQVFFIRGVELVGPGRASVFTNLVPIFGALMGVALLGEQFHLFHLLALALVAGGVWLAQGGVRRPRT